MGEEKLLQVLPVGKRAASFFRMFLFEVELKEVVELLAAIGAVKDGVSDIELAVAEGAVSHGGNIALA